MAGLQPVQAAAPRPCHSLVRGRFGSKILGALLGDALRYALLGVAIVIEIVFVHVAVILAVAVGCGSGSS